MYNYVELSSHFNFNKSTQVHIGLYRYQTFKDSCKKQHKVNVNAFIKNIAQ